MLPHTLKTLKISPQAHQRLKRHAVDVGAKNLSDAISDLLNKIQADSSGDVS